MPLYKWCTALILYRPFNLCRATTFRPFDAKRLYSAAVQASLFDSKTPHGNLLTVLYRTNASLPEALLASNAPAWSALLRKSGEVLSGVVSQKPRIAVLSLDQFSRSHEVVSALLDNPLISDENTIKALRTPELPNDRFVVSHGELRQSRSALTLDVPFLRAWDIEVIEIPSEHPDAIALLYDADIQLLVATPSTPAMQTGLLPIFRKPGVFLVLRHPTFDQQVVDDTVLSLTELNPDFSETIKSRVITVYPPKAFSAVDIFRKDSTASYIVQNFQNDYIGSGVPSLSNSISAILSTNPQTLKVNYATGILDGALHACGDAAALLMRDATVVQSSADNIRSQVLRTQGIIGEVALRERVVESLQRATKMVQPVMNAIPWWRLPFLVDDLNYHITSSVERAWCRDLQSMLEFQSGRLSLLQSQLTSDAFGIIKNLPPSFHSALLLNELEQLSSKPPIGPTTLTYPISYRLQQLQQPTIKLHRYAQRLTFLLSIATFGSGGSAYAAWFWDIITPSTALGLGSLGFILALRWFVGKWDKAKTRWWQDWTRVGEGLGSDLQETLSLIIREKVTSVPMKAVDELEEMARVKMADGNTQKMNLENIKASLRDQHVPPGEPSYTTRLQQEKRSIN